MHDEDSIENDFQSQLKFQSQNKGYGGKKNNGEISRNRENSKNFFKSNQNKYPPCDICKRTNLLKFN